MVSEYIGSYRLIERLGRGGMGEVWEALDTAHERHVALKLLPPEALRNPDLEQRFRTECQLAASVEHPHVLPVYDYEVGARPYIAMRLIRGTDLASEIEKGPLAPERAVHIVEQVAAALEAAHQLKLRHRDVKPSNILLEPGAKKGTDHAWLFDWGIAQLIDLSTAPVTRAGIIVGTPGYIAPERLQWADSDHRADVYSLTVVLYECLTGRRPFMAANMNDLLRAIVRAEPPELPAYLPAGLRSVVARGLAKRPEDRYQSARELAAAARDSLDAASPSAVALPIAVEPEKAPPDPTVDRPVRPPPPPPPAVERAPRSGLPVVGAAAGLVIASVLLLLDLIDEPMFAWVLPALVVAFAGLEWSFRPRPAQRPAPQPGPTDPTRPPAPGGVPPPRP